VHQRLFAPLIIGWLAEVSDGGMADAMKWSSLVLICAFSAYLFGPETLSREKGSEIVDLVSDAVGPVVLTHGNAVES